MIDAQLAPCSICLDFLNYYENIEMHSYVLQSYSYLAVNFLGYRMK